MGDFGITLRARHSTLSQVSLKLNGHAGLIVAHSLVPVYRDVEHIKPLTKSDIIEFHRLYFKPGSSERAKASVHLIAQSSISEIAAKMDPKGQKEKLIDALAKALTKTGVQVDFVTLSELFEKVRTVHEHLHSSLDMLTTITVGRRAWR